MSRASMKRLERLEAERAPKGRSWVTIYARDNADFEAQRKALLESGKIKATDWCFDEPLPPGVESMEPEILPASNLTHEEWVDILSAEEQREAAI
jgi:hypothetical protein